MLKSTHTVSAARAHVLAARAWEHRRSPSGPEARLWRQLSGGKLGVVFRRQVGGVKVRIRERGSKMLNQDSMLRGALTST
jgi:hypothetical protein